MKHRILTLLLTMLVAFVVSVPNVNADDNNGGTPITLDRDKKPDNDRPTAPAYIPVRCLFDGENIIVSSDRDLAGEVKLIDAASGLEISSDFGSFSPALIVPVDDFTGYLTVKVIIDEAAYTGSIYI